jgi:hypothetical protein
MQVNICPRLIEKMIKNGHKFITSNKTKTLYDYPPLGIYATKTYKTVDVVHVMTGKISNIPTHKSIHIGDNMHLEDDFGKYINHSFDPNVKVVNNKLIAIKDIDIYDEITFNYNDSELEMVYPFEDDGVLVCGKKFKYTHT